MSEGLLEARQDPMMPGTNERFKGPEDRAPLPIGRGATESAANTPDVADTNAHPCMAPNIAVPRANNPHSGADTAALVDG
jgi:hypothetical protein